MLDELSNRELTQLRKRIDMKLSTNSNDNVNDKVIAITNDDETMVLRTICKLLSQSGMEFSHPWLLRRAFVFKSFQAKLPGVSKYIDQAKCTRAERLAVMTIGVQLLIRDMQEKNLPVASRQLMAHVHRIPEVINKAFPLYAPNGLLRMIVRQAQR